MHIHGCIESKAFNDTSNGGDFSVDDYVFTTVKNSVGEKKSLFDVIGHSMSP